MDKKALAVVQDTEIIPEGIEYDGSGLNKLTSPSYFTAADNSTQVTISFWVYRTSREGPISSDEDIYTATRFNVKFNTAGDLSIIGVNSAGSTVLINAKLDESLGRLSSNKWHHIIFSADTSVSDSGKMFVDDVELTSNFECTLVSGDIDFAYTPTHIVAGSSSSNVRMRLAHLYFDNSYVDLSVEANRRLFITDDLKPASAQAGLSPLVYLPMRDADTAHINNGTIGDFVRSGDMSTAQRGPNQWNCVASEFDGSADYLTSPALSAVSSTTLTFSAAITPLLTSTTYPLIIADTGAVLTIDFYIATNGVLYLRGRNSANVLILNASIPVFVTGGLKVITFSCDMSNPTNRSLFVNGVDRTSDVTWTTYINDSFNYSNIADAKIGRRNTTTSGAFTTGELYFDTGYTDLSTNNPFWDADTNLPKPVRQVLEETGATPLIAMPIEAGNEGLNLGTGGGFTVNSGPFTSARGGSEFWAGSMKSSDTDGYLSKASLGGQTSGSMTFLMAYKGAEVNWYDRTIFEIGGATNFSIEATAAENFDIVFNGTTERISFADFSVNVPNPILGWHIIQFCYDHATGNYDIRTTTDPSLTASGTLTKTIDLSGITTIGRNVSGIDNARGDIGFIYLAEEYIDLTDYDNIRLFVDDLLYPKDLSKQIEDELIPTPLIYMPFDDPDDLGKNLGTSGDFTENGTVVQGSDVDPVRQVNYTL